MDIIQDKLFSFVEERERERERESYSYTLESKLPFSKMYHLESSIFIDEMTTWVPKNSNQKRAGWSLDPIPWIIGLRFTKL